MTDSAQVDTPRRVLLKASEVCDIAKVQPYVLRSWEAEFPNLGVAKGAGGARVYRQSDLEQVLRIKHLLLVDGLTLAGARRRLDEEAAPPVTDESLAEELAEVAGVGHHARAKLVEVRKGLLSILDLLGDGAATEEFLLSPPALSAEVAPREATARAARSSRGDGRRKRSA